MIKKFLIFYYFIFTKYFIAKSEYFQEGLIYLIKKI